MIILGIDPGTATTGFGCIEVAYATGMGGEGLRSSSAIKVIEWGLIETNKELKKEERLEIIYEKTKKLIEKFSPDTFVFEKVFFSSNAKTVIAVGQAQGVMLLAARKLNIFVAEYAPGTIKKMITGSGRANKKEVQSHVRKILGNKIKSEKGKKTHFDNAADALAIAMTHAMKIVESHV